MELRINETKIENPIVAIALVLFSLTFVGGIVAIALLVILPLAGIVLSGVLAVVIAIAIPILFWFVIPVAMLSILGWFFGKFIK